MRNRKLIQRVYREQSLTVRRGRRKNFAAVARVALETPARANDRWSMDFVRDALSTRRAYRGFTILKDCTKERPAIEVDHSLLVSG